MTCVKCSDDKTAPPGSTKCQCRKATHYLSDPDTSTCSTCPPGADCSAKDDIVLLELSAKPGFWRAKFDSYTFTDCKKAFSTSLNASKDAATRCIGGSNNISNSSNYFNPDDQCELGFGGPSCMACIDGHVMLGAKCTKCIPSIGNVVGAVAGLMLFLFLIFAILFLKAKKDKDDNEKDDGSTRKTKKGCCGGKNKQEARKKKKEKVTLEQKYEKERDKNAAVSLHHDIYCQAEYSHLTLLFIPSPSIYSLSCSLV